MPSNSTTDRRRFHRFKTPAASYFYLQRAFSPPSNTAGSSYPQHNLLSLLQNIIAIAPARPSAIAVPSATTPVGSQKRSRILRRPLAVHWVSLSARPSPPQLSARALPQPPARCKYPHYRLLLSQSLGAVVPLRFLPEAVRRCSETHWSATSLTLWTKH